MNQEKLVNAFIMRYFFNKRYKKVEYINDIHRQLLGIDVIADGINIDLKAQSSERYLNNPTDTFAVELSFISASNEETVGWFLDKRLKTELYGFIWIPEATTTNGMLTTVDSIQKMEVMLVNKRLLKQYINGYMTDDELYRKSVQMRVDGRWKMDCGIDGVHMSHSTRFRELPTNLVIKKQVLKKCSVGHYMVTKDNIEEIT